MLSPLQRQWDEVKGNVKWDIIKHVLINMPLISSLIKAGDAWVHEAPPLYVFGAFLITFVIFWIVAAIAGRILYLFKPPALEIKSEDFRLFPPHEEMKWNMVLRLGITNTLRRTVEIISVEVTEMDTNSSRIKTANPVFPIELFPLGGQPKELHNGETMLLPFIENLKIWSPFGKRIVQGRLINRPHSQFGLDEDYRLRITVLMRDCEPLSERYILRCSDENDYSVMITVLRIPRWKKVD